MTGLLIKKDEFTQFSPFEALIFSAVFCYSKKALTRCHVFELLSLYNYEPSKFLFLNQLVFVVFCYSVRRQIKTCL